MYKVSIACPVFEYYGMGIEMLDDMFKSIKDQDFPQEYIQVVVSDQSLDNKIENWCKENIHNLNIKYVRAGDRGNPSINTNNAIDNCDGEVIKLIQQDDYFVSNDALQITYNSLINSDHEWFATGCTHTRNDGETYYHNISPYWDELMVVENKHNSVGGVSTIAFKNGVDIRFDPNLRFFFDVDFYQNLYNKYGIGFFFPIALIAIRVRETNRISVESSEIEIQKELNYLNKKHGVIK